MTRTISRIDRSVRPFCIAALMGPSIRLILHAQNRFFATVDGRIVVGGNPERPPQMLCICAPYRGFRGRSVSPSLAGKFRISAYVPQWPSAYGQGYESTTNPTT